MTYHVTVQYLMGATTVVVDSKNEANALAKAKKQHNNSLKWNEQNKKALNAYISNKGL